MVNKTINKNKILKEPETNRTANNKGVPSIDLLGPKHTGMKVSANGLIGRIEKGIMINDAMRYTLGEMLTNLRELSKEYYAGNINIVDKFLQFYDLDEDRP